MMTNSEAVTDLVEYAAEHSVDLTRSRADRAIKALRKRAKNSGRDLPLEVAVDSLKSQLVADDGGVFAKHNVLKARQDPTGNEVAETDRVVNQGRLEWRSAGFMAKSTPQYGSPLHAEDDPNLEEQP